MKFPKDSPVTKKKKNQLLARIERLEIDLREVEEGFVRSPGPGGQKVNKTSSAVCLRYPRMSLVVNWSRERSRGLNRFLALRELVDEIEERISPQTSKRLKDRDKQRRRKRDRRRKARKKYAEGAEEPDSAKT